MTGRMGHAARIGSLALVLAAGAPAFGQTSLFNQPLATEVPAASEPPAAAAKPKPRPKPRGPVPARALTISNASSDTLTGLEVTGGGRTARLEKPLAPQARTTLKLPALKGCIVSVAATFEGSGEAEANDYDVCKERTIRFTQ